MASLIRVTERISSLIDDVLHNEDVPGTLQKELKQYQQESSNRDGNSIPFDLLHEVFKHSKKYSVLKRLVCYGAEFCSLIKLHKVIN